MIACYVWELKKIWPSIKSFISSLKYSGYIKYIKKYSKWSVTFCYRQDCFYELHSSSAILCVNCDVINVIWKCQSVVVGCIITPTFNKNLINCVRHVACVWGTDGRRNEQRFVHSFIHLSPLTQHLKPNVPVQISSLGVGDNVGFTHKARQVSEAARLVFWTKSHLQLLTLYALYECH